MGIHGESLGVQAPRSAAAPDSGCADIGLRLPSPALSRETVCSHPRRPLATEGPAGPAQLLGAGRGGERGCEGQCAGLSTCHPKCLGSRWQMPRLQWNWSSIPLSRQGARGFEL